MKNPSGNETLHRAENGLILACAATVVTEDRRAEIRHLARDCQDWAYVIESCRVHRVSPLVGFTLEATAPDLVSLEVRSVLQTRFKANALRNLFLTQELLSLIKEFRSQGIEMIPFKGPLLAITAYGNVALREFGDLDILVPAKRIRCARELLANRGYHPPASQDNLTESYFRSQLGCDHIREDGQVALELHWSFVQKWLGFHVDLDAVWTSAKPVQVGQERVLALPADIALLYLCAHGTKHHWSRVCWVVDVAEALRSSPELDWPQLLAQAEDSGCRRTLFIGLYMARTLLKTPIPGHVWDRVLKDHAAVALAGNLAEQMFAPEDHSSRRRSNWSNDWFHIRTKERCQEKFIYVRQWLVWVFQPSDKDREWLRLPPWLNWLYLLLRPIRVAWQSLPMTAW